MFSGLGIVFRKEEVEVAVIVASVEMVVSVTEVEKVVNKQYKDQKLNIQ